MVVIRRCCEVHLSQEEINHLEEAADIINRIWSVMLTESYAGKTEHIDTETMGRTSDILQDLAEIGENIIIKDA